MKKSLIVIALVFLMIVPVFATVSNDNLTTVTGTSTLNSLAEPLSDGAKTNSTTVQFTLLLNPKYVFGITTDPFVKANILADITKTKTSNQKYYTELTGVDTIDIPTDIDALTFSSPEGTYYISYWFKDCTENCTLTASIDKHLTLQNGNADADYNVETEEDTYTVKYQAKIEAVSATAGDSADFEEVTIKSPSKNAASTEASTEIKKFTKTDLLGKVECGNLKITIGPVSGTTGSDSIANKKAGKYVSHIILTLTADAPAGNNNNDNTQS